MLMKIYYFIMFDILKVFDHHEQRTKNNKKHVFNVFSSSYCNDINNEKLDSLKNGNRQTKNEIKAKLIAFGCLNNLLGQYNEIEIFSELKCKLW